MKRFILICVVGLCAALTFNAHADKRIDVSELPISAQTFLKENFSKDPVVSAHKDGLFTHDYKVAMRSGAKVEFDSKGEWEEVKCRYSEKGVPKNIVPQPIRKYIDQHFSGTRIVEIERGHRKYEVALSNGLDLEFSLSGEFIKVDD